MKKIIFLFSLAMIIFLGGCQDKPAEAPVNTGGGTNTHEKESPDFVTFTNGEVPSGWITYTWEPAQKGYDDDYSLKSANQIAIVYTQKTVHVPTYLEFYTHIKENHNDLNIDLYIDDKQAQALSSEPANNNWVKWIYLVDSGKHQFKWQTEGALKYLDNIRFLPVSK